MTDCDILWNVWLESQDCQDAFEQWKKRHTKPQKGRKTPDQKKKKKRPRPEPPASSRPRRYARNGWSSNRRRAHDSAQNAIGKFEQDQIDKKVDPNAGYSGPEWNAWRAQQDSRNREY